jgi:hypothetical protein
VLSFFLVTRLVELCYGTKSVTQWMGIHSPLVTSNYLDVWDECCCHHSHNLPGPVWPTQYAADSSCNLRPLHQWGDAMLRISREEPENKLVLWDVGKVLSW